MFSVANQIKTNIQDIEGLVDINVEQQVEIPQIQIKAKRDMLAKFGITVGEFTEFIDVAFAGETVSQIFESDKNFDLVLRFNDENRGKIETIKNVLIDSHKGKIPLYYVANIVSTSGPSTINRENVQRKIVVSANVAERDLRSVVNEIKDNINQNITLPENYRIQYGGQFESEEKASKILFLTSIMSLLIIFLLLYQEFKDVKIAGIILLNLPLALIGGVLSVWFTSGIISIPAIIGFITLFGIATRNGILLVSRYQALQKEGVGLYETIIKGSLD
jgi:Cu/Ag efflux pump CusA